MSEPLKKKQSRKRLDSFSDQKIEADTDSSSEWQYPNPDGTNAYQKRNHSFDSIPIHSGDDARHELRHVIEQLIHVASILGEGAAKIDEEAFKKAIRDMDGETPRLGLPATTSKLLSTFTGMKAKLAIVSGLLKLTDEEEIRRKASGEEGVLGCITGTADLVKAATAIATSTIHWAALGSAAIAKATGQVQYMALAKELADKIAKDGVGIVPGAKIVTNWLGPILDIVTLINPKAKPEEQTEAFGSLGAHLLEVAKYGEPAGIAFQLMVWWTMKGFSLIREAHESGNQDAQKLAFAEMWAKTVARALVSGELPEKPGWGGIESTRRMAYTDALKFLNTLNKQQAEGLKTALLKEFRTEGNAQAAIETELIKRAGYTGYKFHDGSDDQALHILKGVNKD